MKRVLSILLLIVSIAPSLLGLTLNQALKEGLKNNPDLIASFWKTRALIEQEKGADSGANTMLMVGLNNLPTSIKDSLFNDDMMTQVKISLKQKIFFPGKLSLKKAITRELRYIREIDHLTKTRRIKALIKEVYFRLLYLDKIIQLTETTSKMLIQFKKIAQTKYAVGNGLLQDMAKADFEAARLKEIIIRLKNKRKVSSIYMNRLLGRKPNTPIKKIAPFSGMIKKTNLAKIHNLILAHSTSIQRAARKLKSVKWKKKLTRRLQWPNFTIGSSYGIRTKRNTANLFSINLELSIPIFTQYGQKIKALEKKIISQRYKLIAAKKNTLKTATTIFTDIMTKKRLLHLYNKELIPLAKLSVRSAISAYQVGKLEFISLITAQILLYKHQIINENNLRYYRTHFAHLEFLTGESLIKERAK